MFRDYLKKGFALCAVLLLTALICKDKCFASDVNASLTAGETALTAMDGDNADGILMADNSDFVEISDEDVPLGILPTHRHFSAFWIPVIMVIAIIGAGYIARRQLRSTRKVCTFESLSEVKIKMQ